MLHQGTEERRQQPLQVAARGTGHLAREEGHGVFVEVEQATQLVEIGHGLGRRVLDGHLLAQGEDRQLRGPHPGDPDQLHHVLQQPLVLPGAFGGDQDAGEAVVGGGDYAPFGGTGGGKDGEAVLLQLAGDAAHPLAGNRVGLDIAMDDEDGELELFIHCGSLRGGPGPPMPSG
ncbi:hypothetical protein D9M68_675270 [compost metagenome]